MTGSFGDVLRLAKAPRSRFALSVVLGALTVAFGVGLMATAGYLISRAAERPAVLSLTVAIVAVRFFGLARPVARYVERLSSHDLALRVLARVRRRTYERMEPLAPGQLAPYRHGDLLSRVVDDVDTLQNLHLRGVVEVLHVRHPGLDRRPDLIGLGRELLEDADGEAVRGQAARHVLEQRAQTTHVGVEHEAGDGHAVGAGVDSGHFEAVDDERDRLDGDVVDPPFAQRCHRGEI